MAVRSQGSCGSLILIMYLLNRTSGVCTAFSAYEKRSSSSSPQRLFVEHSCYAATCHCTCTCTCSSDVIEPQAYVVHLVYIKLGGVPDKSCVFPADES